jgi:hypothetical protein
MGLRSSEPCDCTPWLACGGVPPERRRWRHLTSAVSSSSKVPAASGWLGTSATVPCFAHFAITRLSRSSCPPYDDETRHGDDEGKHRPVLDRHAQQHGLPNQPVHSMPLHRKANKRLSRLPLAEQNMGNQHKAWALKCLSASQGRLRNAR